MRHFPTILPAVILIAACGSPEPRPEEIQSEAEELMEKTEEVAEAASTIPMRPLFGDTHLHTSLSMDAGTFGVRLKPADAYRFAKGEEVTASVSGMATKLSRPLDFLVVADHSENLGVFNMILEGDERIVSDPAGQEWHEAVKAGGETAAAAAMDIITRFSAGAFPDALILKGDELKPAWTEVIDAAEAANEPGTFTAFIGYEWTSMPNAQNLHRVVIFKDGRDKAEQVIPFSSFDSEDPEELWRVMDAYTEKTGGEVLAIAHNGNLSNGAMFALDKLSGGPLDADYARRRSEHEPLYEATQIKGDGETHPFLSPNDEFADFENWDWGNLDMSAAKSNDMLAAEYAREALKTGLRLEGEFGANPFKFGMIGSTDSHTALATADDDNFFGKHSGVEPGKARSEHAVLRGAAGEINGGMMTASGYAAVWATENTREAIFEAMERRDTYATTGPRMVLRFFGGWDFAEADLQGNLAEAGYARGVSMGGDLSAAGDGQAAPTFLVAAAKDPEGANLDRAQVIKGWIDADGKAHEKVHDVVWSGDRQPGADGRLPPVGDTVDVDGPSYDNSIGAAELQTVWTDPEFDASQRAFYYVRLIEIPTPRWTAWDRKRFGSAFPPEVPMKIQQRAYSSPIWYTPAP